MKVQKLLQKNFVSKIKLIQTMFNSKNLPRTLMIIGAIILIYIVYKKYLKEGFESSPSAFESDLTDDTKLVLFYADWCGHCKKFKPDWEEAAKEANAGGKKIMISVNVGGKDEDSGKLSEKYGVDGFPSVIKFSKGSKTGDYDGPRTKEGLLEAVS